MIKLNNKQIDLTLDIEGYAYPFSRDYWDANWLSVDISITDQKGNIKTSNDPALQTTELYGLMKWFQSLKSDNENSFFIDFMEPCICFTFDNNQLTILLKYGLNPYYEEDINYKCELIFDLNNSEIDKIVEELSNYIRKYPEKNF